MKKIFKNLFASTALVAPIATAVSCAPIQENYWVLSSSADNWINANKWSEYILNSPDSNGYSLDIPEINSEQLDPNSESFIGDVFTNKTKTFEIDYKTDLKNEEDIKKEILNKLHKTNKEAHDFLQLNSSKKYMAIQRSDHHDSKLRLEFKELKQADPSTQNFLDYICDENDIKIPMNEPFYTASKLREGENKNPVSPPKNYDSSKLKGHIIWSKGIMRSTSLTEQFPINGPARNSVLLFENHVFLKNKKGAQLPSTFLNMEKLFGEEPHVISLAVPYIDFSKQIGKILIISFNGGKTITKWYDGKKTYMDFISQAKTINYKTITIKNILPIMDKKMSATSDHKKDLREVLINIFNWFYNNGGESLVQAISAGIDQIPTLQIIKESVTPFIDTVSKETKDYRQAHPKEEHFMQSPANKDWRKLALYKKINTDDVFLDKIVKSFENQKFDFKKLNDMKIAMSEQGDSGGYENWGLNWVTKTNGVNQVNLLNSFWMIKLLGQALK